MSTVSASVPSWPRQSVLRVAPPSQVCSVTGVTSGGSSAAAVSRAAAGRSVIAATSAVSRPK
jgi:hypothetical protein